ncbi:MAG TPA: hypothetical protein VKA90_08220, partial [Beijerinckiaceae bacterium]|nr:hypothetical protein [Beijerinckiaceae bacterium]
AYQIARTFVTDPKTEKVLAGRPAGLFRGESPERKAARAELNQLQHAPHDYGRSLVSERARVVREHEAEEQRGQIGVPRPSAALAKALEAPADRQA